MHFRDFIARKFLFARKYLGSASERSEFCEIMHRLLKSAGSDVMGEVLEFLNGVVLTTEQGMSTYSFQRGIVRKGEHGSSVGCAPKAHCMFI